MKVCQTVIGILCFWLCAQSGTINKALHIQNIQSFRGAIIQIFYWILQTVKCLQCKIGQILIIVCQPNVMVQRSGVHHLGDLQTTLRKETVDKKKTKQTSLYVIRSLVSGSLSTGSKDDELKKLVTVFSCWSRFTNNWNNDNRTNVVEVK